MEWKVPRAMFTEFYLVFFFKLDSVLTELKPYTAVKCTEICFHTRFFLWKEKSLGRCLPSFFLPSFGVARRWPVCAQRDTLRASSFSSVSFFFYILLLFLLLSIILGMLGMLGILSIFSSILSSIGSFVLCRPRPIGAVDRNR